MAGLWEGGNEPPGSLKANESGSLKVPKQCSIGGRPESCAVVVSLLHNISALFPPAISCERAIEVNDVVSSTAVSSLFDGDFKLCRDFIAQSELRHGKFDLVRKGRLLSSP
ncbi:hypothetical protein ANN_05050 [Periplaneta americana]|uniref:Uncharacterized protein n=1 Tax=Periplaneta americana TaxID=6978 RepID=A0ABQ8TA08_PERAM|nr:hypothetical protein ANN_05050 [Periplaneta americana]